MAPEKAVALLERAGWQSLSTGTHWIELRYTGDADGGTFYVMQVTQGAPLYKSYDVARRHLPANAKLIDGEALGGFIYLTFHLPRTSV